MGAHGLYTKRSGVVLYYVRPPQGFGAPDLDDIVLLPLRIQVESYGCALAQILHLSRKTLNAVNRPLAKHQVLNSKIRIATCLEDTTKLERPRNGAFSKEEERHLHGITQQPVREDTQTETFAAAISLIRHDLGKRQRSFNTQSHITLKCDIGIQAAE
jgi:hypothetical protein